MAENTQTNMPNWSRWSGAGGTALALLQSVIPMTPAIRVLVWLGILGCALFAIWGERAQLMTRRRKVIASATAAVVVTAVAWSYWPQTEAERLVSIPQPPVAVLQPEQRSVTPEPPKPTPEPTPPTQSFQQRVEPGGVGVEGNNNKVLINPEPVQRVLSPEQKSLMRPLLGQLERGLVVVEWSANDDEAATFAHDLLEMFSRAEMSPGWRSWQGPKRKIESGLAIVVASTEATKALTAARLLHLALKTGKVTVADDIQINPRTKRMSEDEVTLLVGATR